MEADWDRELQSSDKNRKNKTGQPEGQPAVIQCKSPLFWRLLRRSTGFLKSGFVRHGAGNIGLCVDLSGDGLVYFDVVAVKRLRGVSIKLHTRLGVICHGANQSGFGRRKIARNLIECR